MLVDWGIFWYIYIIFDILKFWFTVIFIKQNYFHNYQPLMTFFIHILSHNSKVIYFFWVLIKASSCDYWTWSFIYSKVVVFIAIL